MLRGVRKSERRPAESFTAGSSKQRSRRTPLLPSGSGSVLREQMLSKENSNAVVRVDASSATMMSGEPTPCFPAGTKMFVSAEVQQPSTVSHFNGFKTIGVPRREASPRGTETSVTLQEAHQKWWREEPRVEGVSREVSPGEPRPLTD